MSTFKVEGVILKRMNLGEADRIITAFTKELGKIKFIAKGVRRTKSKLAGSIEPFCYARIIISEGRSLDILSSAEIINNYLGLTPNLKLLKTSSYIAEVVDKVIPEKIQSESVHELINEIFSLITEVEPEIAKVYFQAKFLVLSGLFPETEFCVKCEKKPVEVYFSNEAGGILDEDCHRFYPDSYRIEKNSIKFIRLASINNLQTIAKVKIDEPTRKSISNLMDMYTKKALGKDFKSERI